MPKIRRSNSDETHNKTPTPTPPFSRSLSHDVSQVDGNLLVERKNSFHVRPTSFCRQSSLIDKNAIQNIESDEDQPKLIQNTKQLVILIGMALIEFSGTCGMSVIAPFFANEAASKHASQTMVGLIFAVYPLFVFLLSPIVGKWMPRLGVKFCLIAGCFLEGGTEILFGFVEDLPSGPVFVVFCFVIRIVMAIGSALSATASLSILTVTFKDHIGTVFGVTELFTGLGFMAGPALGGVLYQHGGFKMPFLVCGGLVIVVLFCVFWILPSEESYHNDNTDGKDEELTPISQALRIPGIAAIAVCIVTGGMALSFFDPTLAPYLKKIDPDIQAQQIGLVFMTMAGVYMFVAPITGYIADKSIPGRVCIIIGQFGLCIGFCFIGPAPFLEKFIPAKVWLVAVSGGFIGLAIAPFVVPTLPDMQKTGRRGGLPATLGTDSLISGLFNGFFSIGSVLGPTIGGALSQQYSFEGAAMLFGFIFAAEGIFLGIFTLWERNTKWGRDPPDGFHKLDEEDDNDGNQVMV